MWLSILPGFCNTRLYAIPKDVPLVLGEHGQHPRHCLTARCGEIQRIIQRHEIDADSVQFDEAHRRQFLQDRYEVEQRPAPAIQFPCVLGGGMKCQAKCQSGVTGRSLFPAVHGVAGFFVDADAGAGRIRPI